MKKPDLGKWQNVNDLEGLLFFAQLIEELSFDHTLDSFKARALNTHTRILELLSLAQNIKRYNIKYGSLIPVIQEIEFGLKNDHAVFGRFRDILESSIQKIQNEQSNIDDTIHLSKFMLAEIRKYYWINIKDGIFREAENKKEKKILSSLCNSFVVEIEHLGFSKKYLRDQLNKFFFKKDSEPSQITSVNQLLDFFKLFESQEQEWQAIYRCSYKFQHFDSFSERFGIEIAKKRPDIKVDGMFQERFLSTSKNKKFNQFLLIDNISAKDPFSAKETADRRIEFFLDVANFHDHHLGLKKTDNALIREKSDDKYALITSNLNPMTCGSSRWDENSKDRMRKTIEFLIDNNFDPRSTAILANSLIYHRAAIETRTPENQLLDLWASLEGFLPPPRGDKRTRIDHYVENILPPLTLTYCFKVFTYLAESIKHAGKNIVEIVESIPIDGDFFYKSVAIISCDEFSDQGREICKHLDDFPLLKFRLFRSNQRFNSSLSIYNEIIEHRQLVSWHLQRIYTARNQIIHTANSLPYLRKLVENIHYYVDILIKSMMKIASDYDSPLDITSSTRLLISHEEQYLKTLKNINTKCNKDNFKQILFGENNPLYPL